jgi:hypothetical protein
MKELIIKNVKYLKIISSLLIFWLFNIYLPSKTKTLKTQTN